MRVILIKLRTTWCYYTVHTSGEIVKVGKCRIVAARNNGVTSV
jgi:hypothetical protein